jgi:hypothetical protein
MNEVKVYGTLLGALLLGSYFSWTREDKSASTEEKVTIADLSKDSLRSITLYAKTQTIAVSFKKDAQGKDFPWFTVEQAKKTRTFAGNDKVDKMLESFAPFTAIRSLGKLTGADLSETKLDKPEHKLILGSKSGDKVYDVGGRTSGARDHYIRAKGGSEVYLVGSSVLGDLEFPEGKYMERRLKTAALKDVGKVSISANGKAVTVLHKNRLSPNESFWASDATPDEKSETLGNYLDKLDKLTAVEYGAEEAPYPKPEQGTPVLIATWYGEDEKTVNATVEIWKKGEGKDAEFYAQSNTTHVPVKVSRFSGEQLERDVATIMEGGGSGGESPVQKHPPSPAPTPTKQPPKK